jgi:hypothetical protein
MSSPDRQQAKKSKDQKYSLTVSVKKGKVERRDRE